MASRTQRLLLGLALVAGLTLCVLVAAGYIAARCCVAEGSGLAGPATVVGYALAAAVGAALLATILALRLPATALRRLTLVVSPLGLLVAAGLTRQFVIANAEHDAHLQQAYRNLPAFRLSLLHTDAADARPFERIDVDWGERGYTLFTGGRQCAVALSGVQAVALLGALREVEGVLLRDPFPCAGTLGAVRHELRFLVPEATLPDTQGALMLTDACLARHPGLGAVIRAAARVHADNGVPADC